MIQPAPGLNNPNNNPPGPAPHSFAVDILLQVVGVGLMAIFADMGPNIGKLMVTLMIGFVIIWLITNASAFKGIMGNL